MKTLSQVVTAFLPLALLVSGCGGTAFVNAGCDDFMQQKNVSRQIEIATGYELSVYLCSNPTTGFKWSESAVISDTSVLRQTGHEFTAPKRDSTPVVGAPGTEKWTFKATKKGASTIKMEYGRPWVGGEKGEWTFTLTVVVK
jgi:inhibitor of cysteine peptidase